MNKKYLNYLRRIDAAFFVLKGFEVYSKNGNLSIRIRNSKGHFSGIELPKILPEWSYDLVNQLEDSILILRDKLKEIS